jgi:hypothetical protein
LTTIAQVWMMFSERVRVQPAAARRPPRRHQGEVMTDEEHGAATALLEEGDCVRYRGHRHVRAQLPEAMERAWEVFVWIGYDDDDDPERHGPWATALVFPAGFTSELREDLASAGSTDVAIGPAPMTYRFAYVACDDYEVDADGERTYEWRSLDATPPEHARSLLRLLLAALAAVDQQYMLEVAKEASAQSRAQSPSPRP